MNLLLRLKNRLFPSAPRKRTAKQQTGAWGEACAAAYLEKNGYRITGANIRPARHDEIDLIATQGRTTVFIEVKTRRSETFGRPLAAVGFRKRLRLRRAANAWLRRNGSFQNPYRFDVVEVIGAPASRIAPLIRHIEAIDMSHTHSPFH